MIFSSFVMTLLPFAVGARSVVIVDVNDPDPRDARYPRRTGFGTSRSSTVFLPSVPAVRIASSQIART